MIGWSSSSNMAGLGTVGRTDLARSSRQDQDGSCEILRQRAVGRFTLIESLYRNTLELPPEAYSHAEITLVIEGTVSERYTDRAITCTPGAVRFVPAGEVHQVRFDHGSRCLHIRCDPSVLEQFQRLIPKSAAEITGMAITWLTHRLYAEFSRKSRVQKPSRIHASFPNGSSVPQKLWKPDSWSASVSPTSLPRSASIMFICRASFTSSTVAR